MSDVYSRWDIDPNAVTAPPVSSVPVQGVSVDDVKTRWGVDGAKTPDAGSLPDVSRTSEGRLRVVIRAPEGVGYQNQIQEGIPIVGPLMDKATAAIGAAIQPALTDTKGSTFGQRYTNNLADIQQDNSQFHESHPVGSIIANLVGGGMALGPFAATKLGGAALGTYGPTLGSRIYSGVVGGSAIGASDAALRSENPATGAYVGGAGGLAGPLVGEAVRGGTNLLSNYILPRVGALKNVAGGALDRLTSAMEGETPASIAAAKSRMGPSGFVGDLNPAMTDITGGIADTPGPGKQIVREAYRERAAQQSQRIEQSLTNAVGPRVNMEDFKNSTTQARAAAADPLYEQWRNASVFPTDKLKSLMPRLESAGAFDQAEKLSSISGSPINKKFFTTGTQKEFPTAESWDYVKRGLDSKIDQAYSGGDKTLARSLVGLKQEMLEEIEKTPAGKIWKQARTEFADKSSILDQAEAGRDTFLGGRSGLSVDELREELKGLSGPELQARIMGLRNAADQAMGDSVRGDTTLRNKLLAPNNQEKMRLLLGSAKANKLIESLEQEKYLGDQYQNVSGGSQTTPKKERVNALTPQALPQYNPNLTEPLSWLPPHIRDALRPTNILDAWRGQKAQNSINQLSHIMTMPAGPKMDNLIGAIHQEMARRSAVAGKASLAGNSLAGLISGPGTTTLRQQLPAQ